MITVTPDPVEKGLEFSATLLEEEITCPVCQEHFHDPKIQSLAWVPLLLQGVRPTKYK